MKASALFLLLAMLFIFPVTSNGQVGNLLKNKMSKVVNAGAKTVNKEIDNQIDTAVNKEADKARQKGEARTEANRANSNQPGQAGESGGQGGDSGGAGFGRLFGNKIDLKYNEDYSFTSRIYMVSEVYDKKDVMKVDLYMYYSSTSPSLSVETKSVATSEEGATPVSAVMVLDGENKCLIMLTDVSGMKMGVISAATEENSSAAQPNDKNAKKDTPPTFTKTGKSKVIAGYKCDEYSYTDPDDKSKGSVWFTKEAKLKIDKKGWNNTGMATYYGNPEFNEGIILANEAYDEKGTLTMKSETKEINENFPHSVSVKGYTLRQMNVGQGK